jgi:hypothetical protein
MAMIGMLTETYGAEALAQMFSMAFTAEQQASALAATGKSTFYEVMLDVVQFMGDIDNMVNLMNEALGKGWDYCIANPEEKYFDAFQIDMGDKQTEWKTMSSVMLASTISSDWVSLKKGQANGCRMSAGNVERALHMHDVYYSSNQAILPQPCFQDSDSYVRSAKELKELIVDNFKTIIFNGDTFESYEGCHHFYCRDGKQAFDTVNDPFSYYMRGNYQDLLSLGKTGAIFEELKGYVTMGIAPDTTANIAKYNGCTAIKTAYREQSCCGAA